MAIVLAYHGCNLDVAQSLLGGLSFKQSVKSYDWLGKGIYFWEADVLRAYDWAKKRRYASPSVVGAAIDLGSCLDLTVQDGVRAVKLAYESFKRLQMTTDQAMPENVNPSGDVSEDLVLRHLDRAVIDHLNRLQDEAADRSGGQQFETIRALFPEGTPLYPNAGFRELTHVQICVRKPQQILGVFRIPEHQRIALHLPSLYGAEEDGHPGLSLAASEE